MNKQRKRLQLYKRVTSVILAMALMMNSVFFNGAFSLTKPLTVEAATGDYVPSITSDTAKARFEKNPTFANNSTGKSDFLDFCYFYANDDNFAEKYASDLISVSFIEFPEEFSGFGNKTFKFKGEFRILDNGTKDIKIPCALFTHVYDSAKLTNVSGDPLKLKVIKTSDRSSALVAEHVYHDDLAEAVSSWDITIPELNTNSYAGVIGVMEKNAKLNITYTNSSAAEVLSSSDGTDNTADVGSICGTMKTGSELMVNIRKLSNKKITSSKGNAGGLVGSMEGTSKLVITSLPSGFAPTISAPATDENVGYAGGVVGSLMSSATIDTSALGTGAFAIDGKISGGNAAGGYAGRYVNSAENATLDLSKYNIKATMSGTYNGGVFGLLENNSAQYTITGGSAENSGIASKASSGTYGGIIGKYTTNALTNTLYLKEMSVNATAAASLANFGGAIGLADSAAYINADNVIITASGVDKGWFGGLIGETSVTNGVFVDLGAFTLNASGFTGGGVVGTFHNGVLRLNGTTDMTSAKPKDGANGQIIGINDNVLTYGTGNFIFKRSSAAKCDDLGTWGEVVRISNIETNILELNSTDHTVTLAAAVKSMDTQTDFVKTALNMQLNKGSNYDCLLFDSASKRDTLLAEDLALTDNISLSGTGITGFMRDGGDDIDIGVFSGTLDGNNHTITLAVGEPYGEDVTVSDDSYPKTEGVGQIYRHKYNGLFAQLGGESCIVKNLTIDGVINVSNCVDGMNIGGVAAVNSGDVTLTKVTAGETVNYNETTSVTGKETTGKNIGGYIGLVGKNGNITINGISSIKAKFNFSGQRNSWNAYGGAIGKVTASEFTINIGDKDEKLTNALKVTAVTTNGENSYSGGLIGYITAAIDQSKRTVNLNNLEYDGCTIVNPATKNGGGLLGYAWLKTTTNVNGVTVTDATITNSSAPNVGAMLYESTGVMKVDSLAVNKLTMADGAETSLGMIVNHAYNGSDGLYLDVLNSGYTYTTANISLPKTALYDELAVYTAKDADNVIRGTYKSGNNTYGAGVISINMGTRENTEKTVSVAATGTYQNKITSQTNPNKYARYYYNLDKMNKEDATQNVVLWSVKKYAAANINIKFDADNEPLNHSEETNIDFTGISFYPVYSAGGTVKNVNITFDYSRLYNAEAVSSTNTDNYIRDPGASGDNQNQHYLMQSGLFITQGEGTTITVNNTALLGTFLEVGDYNGVLISKISNGSITINGLELNGITPKTTGNAGYSDKGYLLVNSIKRANTQSGLVTLKIEDVKTGTESGKTYAQTDGATIQVAKSLFGDVYGPGLNISFKNIKLDAREKGTLSENTALNDAYGTTNSIFTAATFFNSLTTDSNSTPTYNYTYDEDWSKGTRAVTYGKEVSESVENKDKQHKYYREEQFTSPETKSQSANYIFYPGWLPYVKTPYDADMTPDGNGCYLREIRVNVFDAVASEGCGTYNDPYIIDSEKATTFVSIANFLYTGEGNQLLSITLPLNKDKYDSVEESTSGARWCEEKEGHAEFTFDGTNYTYTYTPEGGKETTVTWTAEQVRLYLESAYYMIDGEIELEGEFPGLGGDLNNNTSGKYAFRGVIVGKNNNAKITNNSTKPLINISNGCVVKNLTVVQNVDVKLTQKENEYNKAAFGYKSFTQENGTEAGCAYYGGIIGEIMGGDNIIDNCYVEQAEGFKVTLDGTYGTICPVGSYVGVVVFGGLIFKNMSVSTANTNASSFKVYYKNNTDNNLTSDTEAAKAAIYVNPFVGRVINGYAVNETKQFSVTENGAYHDDDTTPRTAADGSALTQHSLKNTAKHYTIADINKDLDKLDVYKVPKNTTDDGIINIPNSQAFFILSLITQSCAGTAQAADDDYKTSLSYGIYNNNGNIYGKSHIADYNYVGNVTDDKNADYLLAAEDTAKTTAVPYIIKKYTKSYNKSETDETQIYNARCVTSTLGYYDINLTSGVTYTLPDSFRGLGSVGNYDTVKDNKAKFSIKLDVFNGNGCTIDEDIYLNKFKTDNYFDVMHNGTNQDVSSNTQPYKGNTATDNHGIGLFDSVIAKEVASEISHFTLKGSVNAEIYNNTYTEKDQNMNFVGNTKDATLWLSVGGVCGWNIDNSRGLNFREINLNDISINGADFVGGLLGYSGIESKTVKVTVTECNADNISVKMSSANIIDDAPKARNGIGCFVGKVYGGAVIIYGTSEKENNKILTNVSTVKIGSYEFGSDTGDYHVSAGGLVGYAGNGCQAYDMKLSSYASTVTIGTNSSTSYVGGIVGTMQPYSSGDKDCLAVFKNCTIEKINIKGQYAGGLYGGKWTFLNFCPYKIEIDNCKLIGDETEKNTIYASKYAGGFIAWGQVQTRENNDYNIQIVDSRVSNYNISSGKDGRTGGFIGYCEAINNSITCYIHDSSIEKSILGQSGNVDYVGGAIGGIKYAASGANSDHKILGYNIKLDNVTSQSNRMGAWVGYMDKNDTKTSIQFTGLAIYGNGFTKNIGNDVTLGNASFVYADYDGASADMNDENKNKATFNIEKDVVMPKYPYVNVNPQSQMGQKSDGSNAVISGDGAVLLSDVVPSYSTYTSKSTMAAKLYDELGDENNSRRYTTFYAVKDEEIADGNILEDYLKRSDSDDGDRISTYQTEKGSLPNGVKDFACIMISTADDNETTNLINQYIRLVTNTTDDYTKESEYYAVEVNTCKLVTDDETGKSEFKLITDQTDPDYPKSIELSEGQFKMKKDNADSRRTNTFTLIDVQFKDPFKTNKVAYHLYVPVYTTVQMEVDFYAAIKTGTNSVIYNSAGKTISSTYEVQMDKEKYPEYIHVDNLNSWYTMYFRYSYAKNDLENLLNAGNLNWNHNKYVTITKDDRNYCNMLNENTYMTLVDPNGGLDKVYYAKDFNTSDFPREDSSVKLDFTKFKGTDDKGFKVSTLNDMLADSIKATGSAEGKGQFNKYTGEGKPEDFDIASYVYVRDENDKITYYKFNSSGTGDSVLQFKEDFTGLNEDYYVSVYMPESNMNNIYGYEISIDDKFPAPGTRGKSAKVNQQFKSRQVYLGDLYEQTVSFEVTTQDPVITSSNRTIDAYAETTIKAKSIEILSILVPAKKYTELYHSYVLTLDRHGEQGETSTLISGLDDKADDTKRVSAWYSFDQSISAAENPTESKARSVEVASNYINVGTVNDNDNLLDKVAPDVKATVPVTIYSRVRMEFDDALIDTEFPQKTRQDAGVSARVASNLAYNTSDLAFSNSSAAKNDRLERLFYRTSMDTANLYYNAETPDYDKYDYDGEYSENYTRVGVNGRNSMSEYMPIDTIARYNLQKVSQMWEAGNMVQLTITLQKKEDVKESGKITKVHYTDRNDITDYWGGLELVNGKPDEVQIDGGIQLKPKDATSIWVESGDYGQEISVSEDKSVITIQIPKASVEYDNSTNEAVFHISFNAKTGKNFYEYANYKVNLTVQLLDNKGEPIETCTASDYMVYTNAKVNNEYLDN